MGDYTEVICPICKGSCNEYVLDYNNEICGCDLCTRTVNAVQYNIDQDELKADYYRETFMSER